MKKNKISKNWLIKNSRDFYTRESKVQGYRSRAVFKLMELNQKFKFIKKNSLLIDLGSSPGSWSQFVSSHIIKGKILAEIEEMEIEDTDDKFNFGFCISNIGPKIDFVDADQADPSPMNMRMGIYTQLYNRSYN